MNFTGICLITKNLKRLKEFYEMVLDKKGEGNEDFYAIDSKLSIFTHKGMEGMAPNSMNNYGTGGYTIEINVDDVDAEYERLKKADVTFVKLPTTQAWGRRSVWFRDPDGNIINFYKNTK